ncbi:periplasmic heavy metal sensor [Rhodobacter sp. SY28-1]|uniref:periplasmic heavy metal sensor n=1 Tax=Rhodobacter sp. SY28-1 TaxID=2562317 RepID=UPI001485C28F|nr:periplasmic heavy metal sensor [Rhodobacter sp. SY28-1]
MTTPAPASPSPRRSWGRIALICALVLSLLGNAVAVGAWIRIREARAELLGPEAAAARLPGELRQELRIALRGEMRSLRPLLRDVVQAREAIVSAAGARPYVRGDAERAMDDFRASVDALLTEVQRIFLDRLDAKAVAGP